MFIGVGVHFADFISVKHGQHIGILSLSTLSQFSFLIEDS